MNILLQSPTTCGRCGFGSDILRLNSKRSICESCFVWAYLRLIRPHNKHHYASFVGASLDDMPTEIVKDIMEWLLNRSDSELHDLHGISASNSIWYNRVAGAIVDMKKGTFGRFFYRAITLASGTDGARIGSHTGFNALLFAVKRVYQQSFHDDNDNFFTGQPKFVANRLFANAGGEIMTAIGHVAGDIITSGNDDFHNRPSVQKAFRDFILHPTGFDEYWRQTLVLGILKTVPVGLYKQVFSYWYKLNSTLPLEVILQYYQDFFKLPFAKFLQHNSIYPVTAGTITMMAAENQRQRDNDSNYVVCDRRAGELSAWRVKHSFPVGANSHAYRECMALFRNNLNDVINHIMFQLWYHVTENGELPLVGARKAVNILWDAMHLTYLAAHSAGPTGAVSVVGAFMRLGPMLGEGDAIGTHMLYSLIGAMSNDQLAAIRSAERDEYRLPERQIDRHLFSDGNQLVEAMQVNVPLYTIN